jgi:hypothetical protein
MVFGLEEDFFLQIVCVFLNCVTLKYKQGELLKKMHCMCIHDVGTSTISTYTHEVCFQSLECYTSKVYNYSKKGYV